MPYDVRNFLKMASMFGEDNAMNPTQIAPEIMQQIPSMQQQPFGAGVGQQDTFQPNPNIPPGINQVGGNLPPQPMDEIPRPNLPSRGFEPVPMMGAPPMEQSQTPAPIPQMPMQQDYPDFSPITRSSDRAYEMLDQMPQPNKPGLGRKIGASLVSLGVGPEQSRKALYGPYETEMEQWKDKFGPTLQVANQERYYNANMRALHDTMIRDKTAQSRVDVAQQRADTYQQSVENRDKIARAKLDIEQWKLDNPEGTVEVLRDGSIALINKRTGESVNTGLTSKDVNPIELENLRAGHAMERVHAGGAEARETEGVRQQGRQDLKEQDWDLKQFFDENGKPLPPVLVNRKTGESKPYKGPAGVLRTTPPGTSASGAGVSETQKKVGMENRRKELITQHPELEDLITIGDNGEVLVDSGKSAGFFGIGAKEGLSPAEVQKYKDYITAGSGRTIPGAAGPEATIRVIRPDGKTSTIPASQWSAAEAKGYKKVQ